tara:strand:- start:31 stop:288 length:258 start_codon:yes stop_codon:yes gene_type:complete
MKTHERILSDQGGNYIVSADGDAIPIVYVPALTLTNMEYNVLAVALDHMHEHLLDLVGNLDNYEEEKINLSHIDDVLSLEKMFNL